MFSYFLPLSFCSSSSVTFFFACPSFFSTCSVTFQSNPQDVSTFHKVGFICTSVLPLHAVKFTFRTKTNSFISTCSLSTPGPAPSESFPYQDRLTQNYTLYWNFNTTHITFEMVVRTNGKDGDILGGLLSPPL